LKFTDPVLPVIKSGVFSGIKGILALKEIE
jgi:hypothetical protein